MKRVYIDIESVGLHGLPVLIQYAIEDGPIQVIDVWLQPIGETLEWIEWLTEQCVVGFNLAFDWFHINKLYNTFDQLGAPDVLPVDYIDDIAVAEEKARDGKCIKPKSCLDLMLYARKTELQITMERSDIYIRRVPTVLAWDLAKLLDDKIKLDPILFAGRKKKHVPRFQVQDIKQSDGTIHTHLKNVVLRFRPSSSLKAIAENKLGAKVTYFSEIDIDKRWHPKELGYAPFALAIGKPGKWNGAWPEVINQHISHWRYNQLARKYAEDDIKYTRNLDKYWNYPKPDDDDSILACSVAACRWKGYKLDLIKLKALIENYKAKLQFPIAPNRVKQYIGEVLNPIERVIIEGSTKKTVLKEIATWRNEAAKRAQNVLDARAAKKKVELLEKLYHSGRFHASVKVIGALSGRMSGADGLNAQGIDKTKEVRGCFPLAFDDEDLNGGDMMSFEIGIAAADYGDPELTKDLMTCENCNTTVEIIDSKKICKACITKHTPSNPKADNLCSCGLVVEITKKGDKYCYRCNGASTKKFHALFALGFWPDMTYEEVLATEGTSDPIYNRAKNGAFSALYGAQGQKLADTLGLDLDLAIEGLMRFWRKYSVAGAKRRQIEYDFASLYQPNGSGPIKIKEPNDYIESLLGFRRYFTLENFLIRQIYEIANSPPKEWSKLSAKIVRSRRGEQTVGNAVRSALYGAAFSTQNSNIRQAANHRIQSTGAGITKAIQCEIWKFQPCGVHSWVVRPLNIHDEIQCPTAKGLSDKLKEAVYNKVEEFRPLIPLIGIDFGRETSWADK